MFLLPLLFSSLLTDIDQSQRLIDTDFEDALFPEINSLYPFAPVTNDLFKLPWFKFLEEDERGVNVTTDEHNFKIVLDVKQYKPNEIKVKVVDRYIVIKGKHEERKDKDGFVSRQFTRRYLLPSEAEIDKITSKISTNGILTVIAPLKKNATKPTEKTIKIELSNETAVTQKDKDKKVTENSDHKETTTPKGTIHASSTTPKDTTHETSITPKDTAHTKGAIRKGSTHAISTTPKDSTHAIST
ncbi:hypothetical protein M0802_006240 [Mischocyttarus mexicanus]|nr:hypothetical protein M0802_006240 [Mischocyttarus mexicanus]